MIDIGRYYNIDEKYRTYVYCDAYVENVSHFVLICPLYKNLRDKYIHLFSYSEVLFPFDRKCL